VQRELFIAKLTEALHFDPNSRWQRFRLYDFVVNKWRAANSAR